MNILLTCAGRRNYLIQYFREALGGRGKIYAADASGDAPALHEADQGFILPTVTDGRYLGALLELCRRREIRLLVSLNDLELPLLAKRRQTFLAEGIFPVVSTSEVIATCFDKWATHEFLRKLGVKTPRTFLSLSGAQQALQEGDLTCPLVVKPRWGTASLGIEYPEDAEELAAVYGLARLRVMRSALAGVSGADPERCLLIQQRLQGDEFGLDIINDLDGRFVATVAKRKLGMRAGETERAVTVRHEALERLGQTIGTALGHIGNLDCDVFVQGDECQVLEMNPRFGGGYPFSHAAGINLPAALLCWARGEVADPAWFMAKPQVTSAKCDRLVGIPSREVFQPLAEMASDFGRFCS